MSNKESIDCGYARVSTNDQQLDIQLDALKYAGIESDRIFTEEPSGARMGNRPGLKAALNELKPGSKLIIWKFDCLGRNLSELIQTIDLVRQKGVHLFSISENIDTSNAFGMAMYQMIEVFARFERDMIVERTQAGIAAAKERGRIPGRRSALTEAKRSKIVMHMLNGLSFEQIAPLIGISKSTLYNHGDDLRAEMSVLEAADLNSK